MMQASKYSEIEMLRDGRTVEIRALRSDDQGDLAEAVGHCSAESLRRRFFVERRSFTEKEISFFVNVDFVNHVALVAVTEEAGRPVIVGGGRYIVLEPGQAEVAFTVSDQYQGKGIGSALMHHIISIARECGIKELIAEVLSENTQMMRVFRKTGLIMSAKKECGVVHITLQLF